MKNEKEKVMTYLFSCPLPCNREIKVEANNNLDAIDKIIKAGAISCRNSKNRIICDKSQLDLPPIPEKQLKNIVSLCLQECEAK